MKKIKRFLFKSKARLLLVLLTISSIFFLIFIGYFLFQKGYLTIFRPSLKSLALQVLEDCKEAKFRQGCYEKKIPPLMDAPYFLNMNQGFEVMTQVQAQDKSYGYCHVTAHFLSQREVRRNPDDWKTVITKCPAGSCSNGCVHGVFMERFNSERLDPAQLDAVSKEISSACVENDIWQPTKAESDGCFHALGHTAMFLTGADINQSLDFCDKISVQENGKKYSVYSCYQGVFMQIFQPLEAEDKALVAHIRPTKDEVSRFCGVYQGHPRLACFSESWPLFYEDLKQPEYLKTFCGFFEDKDKRYCYTTVLNILTSGSQLDINFMKNYCSHLTSPTPGTCLGVVATRLLFVDKHYQDWAISVCRDGEYMDPNGECFQYLSGSVYMFLDNPEIDRTTFCQKFPAHLQAMCLQKK